MRLMALWRFWLKVAYSNVWIALSAGAQVYVNFRLLETVVAPVPVILAILSMFWVYTFAKAVHVDPKADQENDPERTAFLLAHRGPLVGGGLLGLLFGSWLAWREGLSTLLVFWTPTVIGLLYDLRILPSQFRYRRLKDVPGLKGTSVALAWTLLVLGLVHDYGARATSVQWLVLFVWNFSMWFINTTYFDLGDLDGDRLEGTRTLPVTMGYAFTRRLLHVLNILSALGLLLAHRRGWLPSLALSLLCLNALQAWLLVRARDESSDIGWECDIAFDGMFIWGALLIMPQQG